MLMEQGQWPLQTLLLKSDKRAIIDASYFSLRYSETWDNGVLIDRKQVDAGHWCCTAPWMMLRHNIEVLIVILSVSSDESSAISQHMVGFSQKISTIVVDGFCTKCSQKELNMYINQQDTFTQVLFVFPDKSLKFSAIWNDDLRLVVANLQSIV